MILSDKDLIKLIKRGRLSISSFNVNTILETGHINLHLAPRLLKYKDNILDLKNNIVPLTDEIYLSESGYELKSGEFLLGSTIESISMPDDHFGFIETKGDIARAGIQVHNADGHIDPGFIGNVTLEIKNNANHSILIYSNLPFAVLYVFKLTSKQAKPYQGKYQNQTGPTVYKKH